MIPVRFPAILGFTHLVSPLLAGLHGFWGTWLRYNSLEWNNHSTSLCLALHPKNRTLQPVQIRFLGSRRISRRHLVLCQGYLVDTWYSVKVILTSSVGLSAPMAAIRLLRRTMAIHGEACFALHPENRTLQPVQLRFPG